jgi:hypothetical protein
MIDQFVFNKNADSGYEYGYLDTHRVWAWVHKLSPYTDMEMGTNIFSNCEYENEDYNTLLIPYPLLSLTRLLRYCHKICRYNKYRLLIYDCILTVYISIKNLQIKSILTAYLNHYMWMKYNFLFKLRSNYNRKSY